MTNAIHPFVEKGFDIATDAYERGRPEYPAAAVECLIRELALNENSVAVDVGAGTGKFTRLLAKSGTKLVAIEPVQGMREKFSRMVPGIQVLDGTAEHMPFADETIDAVVVAQAFHWFDGERALKEMHRVLRPRGKLGLIWNARDEQADWVVDLTRIIDPFEKGVPRYKSGNWRKAFDTTSLFSSLEYFESGFVQSGDIQMVLDRIASISFIASMPEQERAAVLGEVAELVRNHPQTRNSEMIRLPYRTDVFVCQRT
ncbi:MAG: class I SAM-dependent methyltransferase [Steroidobacter sp.]